MTTHVIAAERKLRLGPINWDANGDIDLRGFLGEKVSLGWWRSPEVACSAQGCKQAA